MPESYFPIIVILIIAAGLGAVIIGLSTLLSWKNPTPIKRMPYECGMNPIGGARGRFAVRFFLMAILFIIFDIELIFLFPWAVIFKDLVIFGFIEMLIFVLILFLGLIYVWKKGALEWE
jgi:NADH-quinone oxidoreductase subunit A